MARSKKADAIQIINNETEEIREVNIYDLTRDAYLTFGRYVNNWRQLPQIIDGLKISYRRLLYSALTYPQGKLVKSVMLLGKMAECFPGDTEILDVNGNKFSILEINDKLNKGESVYTFSCDRDGNPKVTKIIDVFDKGVVNDLVKITLDNGEHFICTPDHKIMLRTGLFMKAKDLKEGSSLMPIYLDIKPCHNMTRRFVKTNQYDKYAMDRWTTVYSLASKHYDCKENPLTLESPDDFLVTHHSDFNELNDYPNNLAKIGNIYHRRLHGSKSLTEYNESGKLSERTKEQWKDESYRKFMNKVIHDSNITKPSSVPFQMTRTFNIMPDPSVIPNDVKRRNLLKFNHVLEVMNMAISDGVKVMNSDLWSDYSKKSRNKLKISLEGIMSSKYRDLMLSFGIDIELDYNPDITVNRCPELVKNQYVTKTLVVLRSLKMTGKPLTPENFNETYKRIYSKLNLDYDYVSSNLPELVSREVYDKILNKEIIRSNNLSLIYSDSKGNHKVAKVECIHSEQGVRVYDLSVDDDSHNFTLGVGVQVHNCHPHNCESSYNVVCSYVHSGIFDMQGFPGCSSISGQSSPAAAPRYTEVKVSDNYYSILGRLIKKVPYVESPVGPLEPTYIPTPLPISLILENVSGIGLGIATDLPNFSAKSMYQAFINDDPSLLEPNIDIEMDKSKSELHKLWNEGKGKVCYYYKVSPIKGPDGNPGFLIEGDAGIFTPKLKRIKDWQSEGKVYIEDMITQDGAKLAIYKVPNIKSLSIDELGAEVNKVCVNSNTYNLNVSDGGSAFRIPLREWIKATYTNYINLVTQDNLENIEACKFDIQVYSNIEQVANYIINENPKAENEEIAEKCNISIEIVNAIMSRTISNLRKTKDQTEKVKSLKAKLKELKAFDAVKFTEEIVNKL